MYWKGIVANNSYFPIFNRNRDHKSVNCRQHCLFPNKLEHRNIDFTTIQYRKDKQCVSHAKNVNEKLLTPPKFIKFTSQSKTKKETSRYQHSVSKNRTFIADQKMLNKINYEQSDGSPLTKHYLNKSTKQKKTLHNKSQILNVNNQSLSHSTHKRQKVLKTPFSSKKYNNEWYYEKQRLNLSKQIHYSKRTVQLQKYQQKYQQKQANIDFNFQQAFKVIALSPHNNDEIDTDLRLGNLQDNKFSLFKAKDTVASINSEEDAIQFSIIEQQYQNMINQSINEFKFKKNAQLSPNENILSFLIPNQFIGTIIFNESS